MPSLARFLLFFRVSVKMVVAHGLLTGALLLTRSAAKQNQAQQPDAPAPPEPPVTFENPVPPGAIAFLAGYAGGPAKPLLKDKAFDRLMKDVIPKTTYHYGRDMSLRDAVEDVIDGSKLPVMLRDGRYLMVSGEQGPYLRGRGFLWFDLQQGVALGGFYFTPTNGEPSPTLTIFSRQLTTEWLEMSQMPQAFVQDLYQWEEIAKVPPVTPRYFIPVNGKKYVLVHDEDYCWHPENTPAPAQNACEQMNFQAADADVNAAYFMHETHNAANATAWMLGPDQVAWLGVRNQNCVGAAGLGCRIRMTRERTWTLIGGPRPVRPRPAQATR